MTDSTITTAAANGGTSTDPSTQQTSAEPVYGFARLRESEVYHLTGLVQSALDETEHMVRTVHQMAQDRWFDHKGATEPLDKDQISRLLTDAYQCAIKAATVIDQAAQHWLEEDLGEPGSSATPGSPHSPPRGPPRRQRPVPGRRLPSPDRSPPSALPGMAPSVEGVPDARQGQPA
jgi:hypothetical protein